MKKTTILFLISFVLFCCKEETKASLPEIKEVTTEVTEEVIDPVMDKVIDTPVKQSIKLLKEELTSKGYKIFDYVDEKTKDTVLMQQYFMAFLKKGPIRGQNEEESAELQKLHLEHLTKMYDLGYADISGPFGDDGDMRGVTIYNVPSLKMADSLANSDPMVIAGRLIIEIHPWWAASYEARKFGVKSAMAGALASKLCPDLIFVRPNFERYTEISKQIRKIFYDYTDLVEPLSLDEAYLDVTKNKKGNPSASLIAEDIRARILKDVGLTASAGISINKFIAKVASDYNKPNGQKTVNPEEVREFLEKLDIRKFYGIGKVTAEKMYQKGIFTGLDLKSKTTEFLEEHFGKSGKSYYYIVRGIQKSEVKPDRTRKSLAAERTFSENLSSEVFMLEKLDHIAEEVSRRLLKSKVAGKTVTLKIKYSDFTLQTRSKTLPYYISDKAVILETAKDLLYQEKLNNSVRLLGISMSNLNTEKKKKSEPKKSVSVQLKFEF